MKPIFFVSILFFLYSSSPNDAFELFHVFQNMNRHRHGKMMKMMMNNGNINESPPPPPAYPLPRKAVQLIEKARELDPSLAKGESKGSYCPVGWSNRLGTVLTPVSIPGVYVACRPFYWNQIDVGCRMTVIQLQSSSSSSNKNKLPDLWIHSPVGLDDTLCQALDQLGIVRHVVSPNYEHVKYAKRWSERYPNAFMWGCPGIMEKEPDVPWNGELPPGCRPPTFPSSSSSLSSSPPSGMWNWDEIQPLHIDCEVNPFNGKPFFNEVIFYHTPSKTLILTDTYWNYPTRDGITNSQYQSILGSSSSTTSDDNQNDNNNEQGNERDLGVWKLAPAVEEIPFGSSLWKIGMDKIFRPFYLNLMVQSNKKEKFQQLMSFAIGMESIPFSWDLETVIPAHGDIIRGRTFVRSVLQNFFKI